MKRTISNKSKFDVDVCSDGMTFSDCEIAILRNVVDEKEKETKKKILQNEEMQEMINIVREFIIRKKLMCYGGTAINNILPPAAQFYDYNTEIPDFDFYSNNSLNDAIELADIYHKKGFQNIEAKSGVHKGTFKVFVNFVPIADITYMNKVLFENLFRESIVKDSIHYVPVNFLRMGIYLELSRPDGDTSRWEKITQRLNLLDKYYPFTKTNCNRVDFTTTTTTTPKPLEISKDDVYVLVRDKLIELGTVFFGGYARFVYSKYVGDKGKQARLKSDPSFDVLSDDFENVAKEIKKTLEKNGVVDIKLEKHGAFGELIPEYVEISIDEEPVVFIYAPIACHSYNEVKVGTNLVKIATIDTILTFYLTFIYANKSHYNKDRLLCMSKYLFELHHENRLARNGPLKVFSTECYGKQETLHDIFDTRAQKLKELKNDKESDEYKQWFLKYDPSQHKNMKIKKAKTPSVSTKEILSKKDKKSKSKVKKSQTKKVSAPKKPTKKTRKNRKPSASEFLV